jgi:hypothetical protein
MRDGGKIPGPEDIRAASAISHCLQSLAAEVSEHGLSSELRGLLILAAETAQNEARSLAEAMPRLASGPTLVFSRG